MAAKRKKTTFDRAALEITRQIEDILNGKKEQLDTLCRKTADYAVEELKNKSPERTGSYAKSWTWRKETRGSSGDPVYIVHNEKRYQLTHLLNNGHAARDGSWVKGDNHITKVYKELPKKLQDAAVKELNK